MKTKAKKIAAYSAFLLFSLSMGLLLTEGIIRVFSPHRTMGTLIEKDELVGYHHAKNAKTQYIIEGKSFSIRTNNVGLRQDESLAEEKKPGEKRILFVGASFLFGWGVEIEQSFFHALKTQLTNLYPNEHLVFLNGGHGGWGTAQMLAYVEHYSPQLKPDLIFFFMGPNDIEDTKRTPGIYRMQADGTLVESRSAEGFVENRNIIARTFPIYDWLLFNSYLVQMIRPPLRAVIGIAQDKIASLGSRKESRDVASAPATVSESDDVVRLTQAMFLRLKQICDRRNVPLVVTTVASGPLKTHLVWNLMGKWFPLHQVDFFDKSEEIDRLVKASAVPVYMNDGHFNEAGNALFAKAVLPAFKTRLDALSLTWKKTPQ